MIRSPRKLFAVLLAIWLPLFSGNALAVSVEMQSAGGKCHEAQSSVEQYSRFDTSAQQPISDAEYQVQPSLQIEQQNNQQHPLHKDCGVCQLACCGYLATVMIEVAAIQQVIRSFTPASTQFHSFTSAPLVPPPLALA